MTVTPQGNETLWVSLWGAPMDNWQRLNACNCATCVQIREAILGMATQIWYESDEQGNKVCKHKTAIAEYNSGLFSDKDVLRWTTPI